MKKHITFFTLSLFTFDSFAGPKDRRTKQAEIASSAKHDEPKPSSIQKASSFEEIHHASSTADTPAEKTKPSTSIPNNLSVEELERTRPLNSPRNSPINLPATSADKSSNPTATSAYEENLDGWEETSVPAGTLEATPLSDIIQSWKMWLKNNIEDPKLSDRIKRFFNLSKTYDMFLSELDNCPETARQTAFDNLIKTFNTSESPRFGYELLSEAMVQAIKDGKLRIVHLLTNLAIKHRAHLPPAILQSAKQCLAKENEAAASAITADLTEALIGIHKLARTIKAIQQPESSLNNLSEENADSLARDAIDKLIATATNGFVQRPLQLK